MSDVKTRDARLPAAGTILERKYKGQELKVTVNEGDFTYNGQTFKSLSKLAAEVCGQKAVNGFAFFDLGESSVKKPRKAKDATATPAPTPAPKAAAPVATPAAAPASLSDLATPKV